MSGIPTVASGNQPDPLTDGFVNGHVNSDADLTPDSLHHTLGFSPTQASPGGHTHNGKDSVGLTPPGSIIMYAGTTVPSTYLLCDGSVISRTTYKNLFAAIGTTYGAGDGSTTFAIPNFTNKFARGNTLGVGSGADSHSHTGTTGNNTGTQNVTLGSGVNVAPSPHTHTLSADNNVPAYTGIAFLIKV